MTGQVETAKLIIRNFILGDTNAFLRDDWLRWEKESNTNR